jgi:hypothetical protein
MTTWKNKIGKNQVTTDEAKQDKLVGTVDRLIKYGVLNPVESQIIDNGVIVMVGLGIPRDTAKFQVGGTMSAVPAMFDNEVPSYGQVKTEILSAVTGVELVSNKGVANGYAPLDANNKIPLIHLNDAILGQVKYMGLYDALNNLPALPSATTNKGSYWVVSAAGTQAGNSFAIGDWIISNGTTYDKVDNTDAVSSVNGMTGNVVIAIPTVDQSIIDGSTNAVSGEAVFEALKVKANISGQVFTGNISATNLSGINTGDHAVNNLYSGLVSNATHTGDVTGATILTIAADAVTYAKMQNVSAQNRILGRISAGAGDVEEITGTQLTTIIDVFSPTLKGVVPASGGGTANFLRADGTWAAPPVGGGITDGDKGDITVTSGVWTIDVDVVSNTKLANMATSTIKGRSTAGTGDPEDLTAAQVRAILNVADGATNYSHPTGDGNLHVPATGTTNNAKFLKAGASAGSLSWSLVTASDVGLGNVTNESKATMFTSAALTGTPTAPTAAAGTNTTQIATTAFVTAADANNVKTTGTQSVGGLKTFTSTVTFGATTYSAKFKSEITFDDGIMTGGIYSFPSIGALSGHVGIASLSAGRALLSTANIGNTARTFTLPDKDGIVAMTSDLSNYLPLTGGTVTGSITATAFYQTSDARVKQILSKDGEYIEYKWLDERDDKIHYGVVAQEVKDVNLLSIDSKGYLSVNYIEFLVKKVRSLEEKLKRHGLE